MTSATLQFALKFGLPIIPVIERPDGLTKSFVPEGYVDCRFCRDFASCRFFGVETTGRVWLVNIPAEQVERYIELAQQHFSRSAGSRSVGTGWAFVFPDGVLKWDSVESDQPHPGALPAA